MKLIICLFALISASSVLAEDITLFGACYNNRTETHVCHFNSSHCLPAQEYEAEREDYRGRTIAEKPAEPAETWWTPFEVISRGFMCHCDEDSETHAAGACYDSVTHDVSCHFDASECPPDVNGNPTYFLGNRYTSRVTIDPNGEGEQCTCHDHFAGGPGSATYGVCYDEKTETHYCTVAEHTCEENEEYFANHVLVAIGGELECKCRDVRVGACYHTKNKKKVFCAVDSDSCDEDHEYLSARQLSDEYPKMDCRLCSE